MPNQQHALQKIYPTKTQEMATNFFLLGSGRLRETTTIPPNIRWTAIFSATPFVNAFGRDGILKPQKNTCFMFKDLKDIFLATCLKPNGGWMENWNWHHDILVFLYLISWVHSLAYRGLVEIIWRLSSYLGHTAIPWSQHVIISTPGRDIANPKLQALW